MNTQWNQRLLVLALMGAFACSAQASVKTGLDRIGSFPTVFTNKRIGIIANQTAVDSQDRFIVDAFKRSLPQVELAALFAPEHGLWGVEAAGQAIGNAVHPVYQVPVHSLYGKSRKPTPAMLSELDVLVFDIQDIGARFYTYIWTMALAMEAAAEQGIAFVVLDRPNPITGLTVQGNVLDAQFSSFVGLHPIPVVHGMTVGEMARLLNQEGWLKRKVKADLVVIPMTGWERGMWYEQTGLIWRKPSPNMPDIDTAAIYPGMALLEGTNVSEGRGTDSPFKQFGAPWIDARTLTDVLNRLRIPGVGFTPVEFTPASSKHTGLRCFGCRLVVKNRDQISAYRLGLDIVKEIRGLYPEQLEWRTAHFDRLCGTDKLRQAIVHDEPLDILMKQWQKQMKVFELTRAKYLLY